MNTCRCGCGGSTTTRYARGHHMRSRRFARRDPAAALKAAETMCGRKRNPAAVLATARGNTGKKRTRAQRRRISVAHLGIGHTLATRRKMSKSRKGKIFNKEGYSIHTPSGYVMRRAETGKWRTEHRVIAEKVLGRKLKSNEVVHHVDKDRANNKHTNLVICTQGYHMQLHSRMENK